MSLTAVVGGGLSGLACAYTLAKRGRDVVLLEAGDLPGGVVQSEERDGYLLEWGPNTVCPTPALMRLVEELGLSGEQILTSPRAPRFVDYGGRLHRVPMSPGALIGSRLLSARGKLRLLAEPLVGRGGREGETIREFTTRRLGREVAERLVEPLVGGIFAGDAGQLEAAEAFPRLVAFEKNHGGLLRGALAARKHASGSESPRGLLSFRRGLATLPLAIGRALGSRMVTGIRVSGLARDGEVWRLQDSAREIECSHLVLAAPAYDAATLLAGIAPAAANALRAIPHPALAVLQLAYPVAAFPRRPEGFGHLVVPQSGRRILGAIWSSSLFPDRAPEGKVLLTVFIGGARDPDAVALPDETLLEIVGSDLRAALQTRAEPELIGIRRHLRSIPQYVTAHSERMRVIEEAERRVGGLSLLGNYRGGISVGDVVDSAERLASSLDDTTR